MFDGMEVYVEDVSVFLEAQRKTCDEMYRLEPVKKRRYYCMEVEEEEAMVEEIEEHPYAALGVIPHRDRPIGVSDEPVTFQLIETKPIEPRKVRVPRIPREEAPRKKRPAISQKALLWNEYRCIEGKTRKYRGPLYHNGESKPSTWEFDAVLPYIQIYMQKCHLNPYTIHNYVTGLNWCKQTFDTQDTKQWYMDRDDLVSYIRANRHDANVTKSSFKKLLEVLCLLDPILFPAVKLVRVQTKVATTRKKHRSSSSNARSKPKRIWLRPKLLSYLK